MDICFDTDIPLYGRWDGEYGFVDGTKGFPRRKVQTDKLFLKDGAVCVLEREKERFEQYHPGGTDYDLGGMLFRMELPAGTYDFEIQCMGGGQSTAVAVSGMNPERILQGGWWDAGELVPVRHPAIWEGNTWKYSYVNGGGCVDIALEPLRPDTVIGVRRIRVNRREAATEERGLPCIRILGDSTAKSYVFEEAPMSGWGQLFYRMVDAGRASVVNYSNGGRSLRVMYQEGRLNDMLLSGRKGDYVLLQSGHNDERDGDLDGENSRFGRGSTEEMYYSLLTKVFLPSIRSVGMIPVLVTPVTRINAGCKDDAVFVNSFQKRDFPAVMRRAAADTGTLLLDLNDRSVEHFNQVGAQAARAMVMSLEPGETPGKTNSGSYANGNPNNHADGTHYKECLSRQYCRMAVLELAGAARRGNKTAEALCGLLRREVLQAERRGDFSAVFPEVCRDTMTGRGAYYRNQIEKMVEMGIFHKDGEGNFRPFEPCGRREFREGIRDIWGLSEDFTLAGEGTVPGGEDKPLLRAEAAEILYDAYAARFGFGEGHKPPYMTDYNGRNIDSEDPNYDVNLPEGETMYYPLTAFENVADLEGLSEETLGKLETVYRLGIMRCEEEIARGSLENGTRFGPFRPVTRERAAKYLYFCFVLGQDIKTENHRIDQVRS